MRDHSFALKDAATTVVRPGGTDTCASCHSAKQIKYFERWGKEEPIKTVPLTDALPIFCIGLAFILLTYSFLKAGRRICSTF